MKTTINRTLGLQSRRLFAAGLLSLISMKGFSSNLLSDLHNAVTNADPHHHFLAIVITVFVLLATAQYYSNNAETSGSEKKTRLINHRNRRIRSIRMERIKPIVIDIMGL